MVIFNCCIFSSHLEYGATCNEYTATVSRSILLNHTACNYILGFLNSSCNVKSTTVSFCSVILNGSIFHRQNTTCVNIHTCAIYSCSIFLYRSACYACIHTLNKDTTTTFSSSITCNCSATHGKCSILAY